MVENLSINSDEQAVNEEVREDENGLQEEGFLEKVEKQSENPGTSVAVQDDTSLAPPVVSTTPAYSIPNDAIILPATQTAFIEGEKADIKKSVKWLRKWCKFMIDKYGSKVFFSGE